MSSKLKNVLILSGLGCTVFVAQTGLLLMVRNLELSLWFIILASSVVSVGVLLVTLMLSPLRFRQFLPLTDIVVVETRCRLDLCDPSGLLAKYSKQKRIKTYRGNITRHTEKGLWADGPIEDGDLEVEGDLDFVLRPVLKVANTYDLELLFKKPLSVGEEMTYTVTWTIRNSFPSKIEFFTVSFDNPAEAYYLEILFPSERPAKNAWVEYTFFGEKKKEISSGDLHLSDDHRLITLSLSRVRTGMKSIVFWDW